MRLASRENGRPDGELVEVSEDGTRCAPLAAPTLQAWLDTGGRGDERVGGWEPLDAARLRAPLPRAYQFLDGSAYVNHVALVRHARGAPMPESFWLDPLMYQGGSDGFLGPTDPISGDPDWGLDFEGEVAVVTGPVRRGAGREEAAAAIRLLMLCNDVSLRALIPEELAKGFGFVQSKPASAFSPFAVTPDAVPGWDGGKLNGVLCVDLDGRPFGRAHAGDDMTFDFPALIAHAARTRALGAGTIIGSGTVSNREGDGPGRPVSEGGAGYSCIAEQRMVETIREGVPATPFLRPGNRVRIWMEDATGASIFGDIDQPVIAIREAS